MMNKKFHSLFQNIKTLIVKPTVFFTTIAPKKTFKQALLFDVAQTYIGFLPMILMYSLMFSFMILQLVDFPFYYLMLGALFGIPLLYIVYVFFISLISYIILKIAGGKGTFVDTYKVRVYSSFPTAIGMFLFIFGGGLLSIYSCVLQVIGYAKAHKVHYWKGALPLIIYVLFYVIAVVSFFSLFFSVLLPDLEQSGAGYNFLTEDTLSLDEVETYTLEGLEYEIKLINIDEFDTAVFNVNGQITDRLGAGDAYELADGRFIVVNNVSDNYVKFAIADKTVNLIN